MVSLTFFISPSITKERTEVILQGTASPNASAPDAVWEDYEFKCKPGDLWRRPCLISPYHYRLDWLMWFAAFQVIMSHHDALTWRKLSFVHRQALHACSDSYQKGHKGGDLSLEVHHTQGTEQALLLPRPAWGKFLQIAPPKAQGRTSSQVENTVEGWFVNECSSGETPGRT